MLGHADDSLLPSRFRHIFRTFAPLEKTLLSVAAAPGAVLPKSRQGGPLIVVNSFHMPLASQAALRISMSRPMLSDRR